MPFPMPCFTALSYPARNAASQNIHASSQRTPSHPITLMLPLTQLPTPNTHALPSLNNDSQKPLSNAHTPLHRPLHHSHTPPRPISAPHTSHNTPPLTPPSPPSSHTPQNAPLDPQSLPRLQLPFQTKRFLPLLPQIPLRPPGRKLVLRVFRLQLIDRGEQPLDLFAGAGDFGI